MDQAERQRLFNHIRFCELQISVLHNRRLYTPSWERERDWWIDRIAEDRQLLRG